MNASVVLIHKNNDVLLRNLKKHLIALGLSVKTARAGPACIRLVQNHKPKLIIACALSKNASDELRAISQIRQLDRDVPIIFMAKYSSEALAINAIKTGVNDFFITPFSYKELNLSIKKYIMGNSEQTLPSCKKVTCPSIKAPFIIGDSKSMKEVKANLLRLAQADSTVLITGETGTGKELATRAIHCNSSRFKKPLVCINCAAIPDSLVESELFGYEKGAFTGAISTKKGLFEVAVGGTVLLDEIGDMTPFAQAKILRTIEMKENNRLGGKGGKLIDFRVIAATNQEPERLVTEKKFRKDLYYRLNVARAHMPPLRDRKEDIPLLIDNYLEEFNQRFGRNVKGFTHSAMDSIFLYDWPGNVRELKNLIEVSYINLPSQNVDFIDLPRQLRNRIKDLQTLPKGERDRVIAALCMTNWNKSKAAKSLNWSRMTLYRKMDKYNIAGKAKT